MDELSALYNSLERESKKVKLDTTFLQKNIGGLDQHGRDLLYGMIKLHAVNKGMTNGLPYGGKRMKDGSIKYDLNELPDDLLRTLQTFTTRHLGRMGEEGYN